MFTMRYLVLLISFSGLITCSAKGPAFPNAPKAEGAMSLEGRYRFPLKVNFFYKSMLGELFLERSSGQKKKTYFTMRSFGLTRSKAIRLRSYEGLAHRIAPDLMELRTNRCYLYGKDDWESRLAPMQRWDCDHLFFTYRSPSKFRKRERLMPIQSKRTRYSNWFKPTPLEPIPLRVRGVGVRKPVFFAGQIIHLEESPKSKLVIVWGNAGHDLLRNNQILTAQDDGGRVVGKLKVLSRPGDFIVCRWQGKYNPKASIVYALKAKWRNTSYLSFNLERQLFPY